MYTPSRTQGQSTLVVSETVPWNLAVLTLEAFEQYSTPICDCTPTPGWSVSGLCEASGI